MWWAVCALVGVVTVHAASVQLYHHDYLDHYYDEAPSTSGMLDALTRMRRFVDRDVTTLNSQDINDIRGALKELFSGRTVNFTPKRSSIKTELSKRRKVTRSKLMDIAMNVDTQHTNAELTPTSPTVDVENDWFRGRAVLRDDETTTATHEATITMPITVTIGESTIIIATTTVKPTTIHLPTIVTETTTKDIVATATPDTEMTTAEEGTMEKDITGTAISAPTKDATATNTNIITHSIGTETPGRVSNLSVPDLTTVTTYFTTVMTTTRHIETTTMWTTTETEPITTRTTTKAGPRFDIDALIAIVANMTYDYDTNLTQQLNETLQRFAIPTCGFPTTSTTYTAIPTTTEVWSNNTLIAKCFVCGMETPGIPRNSHCADAFATDFLPLVPIDPRAKGHISRFRKYCKYADVNNFQRNGSDPRAFLGRWTGGCAVRWVDLTGVYTQRTCRNHLRPTTGRHYASKRMAKLELALTNVDDGCVTSPMATLLPLSRGISLYARFHACVCTGNWCNKAEVLQQRIAYLWLLLMVVVEVGR